jgi:serine/threonine protein kinase
MSPPDLLILTEFVPRGSLFALIHDDSEPFPWPRRLRIAAEVAAGLLYLHTRRPPIIHRDLKSDNLLITATYGVKVCDFGLARLKQHASSIQTRYMNAGTPAWMAPETLRGEMFVETGFFDIAAWTRHLMCFLSGLCSGSY